MTNNASYSAGSEFFDLAEHQLNGESDYATHWGNFGHWQTATTYPEACTSLAKLAGDAARLNQDSHLLDLGFGSGEQILYWFREYNIATYRGINVSESQTRFARAKIEADLVITQERAVLHHGDACALSALYAAGVMSKTTDTPSGESRYPTAIIALDSAYHFSDRKAFFGQCANLLPHDGKLVLTDFGARSNIALRMMASTSRIPAANLITIEDYLNQLQRAGFRRLSVIDVTNDVFEPFRRWYADYRRQYLSTQKTASLKFEVTSRFLAMASRSGWLQYYLITAEK